MVADFPVPLPQPIMMHDMALTQRYALLLDVPLVFDPKVGTVGRVWGGCWWVGGLGGMAWRCLSATVETCSCCSAPGRIPGGSCGGASVEQPAPTVMAAEARSCPTLDTSTSAGKSHPPRPILPRPLCSTPPCPAPQAMIKKGQLPFTFESRPARIGVLPRYATSADEIRWFDTGVCDCARRGSGRCPKKGVWCPSSHRVPVPDAHACPHPHHHMRPPHPPTENMMCFHTACAWEDGPSTIRLYLCAFATFSLDAMTAKEGSEPYLTEVSLGLVGNTSWAG